MFGNFIFVLIAGFQSRDMSCAWCSSVSQIETIDVCLVAHIFNGINGKNPRSTRNSTHMYHSPTSSTHQTWFFSIRRGTMHIAYRNNMQVCLITSVQMKHVIQRFSTNKHFCYQEKKDNTKRPGLRSSTRQPQTIRQSGKPGRRRIKNF